jgi:hypothetical protein
MYRHRIVENYAKKQAFRSECIRVEGLLMDRTGKQNKKNKKNKTPVNETQDAVKNETPEVNEPQDAVKNETPEVNEINIEAADNSIESLNNSEFDATLSTNKFLSDNEFT